MEKLLLMGRAPLTSQMVTTLAMASLATPQDPPSHPLVLATLHTAPVSQPDHQPPLLTLSCKTEVRGSRPVMMDLLGLLDPLEVPLDHQVVTLDILAGVIRDIRTTEDR